MTAVTIIVTMPAPSTQEDLKSTTVTPVTAHSAVDRVAAKFPGIRVVSDIQAWACLEEFSTGIEQYRQIADPTGADERWVGVCFFQLIEDEKALHHFRRAVSKGEEAARINLAHLLRFLERGDEGAQELRAVNHASLNEYDQVFYYRLVSLHEENNGNLREGLRAAEEAWRRVQRIPGVRHPCPVNPRPTRHTSQPHRKSPTCTLVP